MNFLQRARIRLRYYLSLVRFSHTIFALPFALMAYFVAVRGRVSWPNLALVLLAMVAARTAAMTFNRIVDRKFDALNPRTASRELVTGSVSLTEALALLALSSAMFILAAWLINRLAFALSPIALAVLFLYSTTKRFTSFTHFFLGLALGIAPVGAWIAATGSFAASPLVLGAGVLFWVAGFDIIYACQDATHDMRAGLHSIVVRLGLRRALHLSSALHLLTVLLFSAFGFMEGLGVVYYIGLAVAAVSFIYQHSIVSAADLSKVSIAFFTTNGIVSLSLFAATIVDLYI